MKGLPSRLKRHGDPGSKHAKGLTGVCALAKNSNTRVLPVDIGIDANPIADLRSLKLARGCGNIARGPAMSYQQAQQLLISSANLVQERVEQGISILALASWVLRILRQRRP